MNRYHKDNIYVKKGRLTMKRKYKILFFAFLLTVPGTICFSQAVTAVPADTAQRIQNRNESGEEKQNQEQVQKQSQNQGNEGRQEAEKARANSRGGNANAENAKAQNGARGAGNVKQVKSARPDWSKAKGARPNIVRPGGSNIPKGVGKPGGAGKPGGR
ncbi:MAG: hypothetical protein JXR66_10500 [Bacteroidales bacterium]|nr:hypothetical protein [Bacteroidales bacterium]